MDPIQQASNKEVTRRSRTTSFMEGTANPRGPKTKRQSGTTGRTWFAGTMPFGARNYNAEPPFLAEFCLVAADVSRRRCPAGGEVRGLTSAATSGRLIRRPPTVAADV